MRGITRVGWRMRKPFIIGLVVAAVLAAGLRIGLDPSIRARVFAVASGSAPVEPGFIGIADFGQWRLICVPAPNMMAGLGPLAQSGAPASSSASSGNACRINREMAAPPQTATIGTTESPSDVILAANFSLVGPKRVPAVMLRLPATARAGDAISLRFDDQTAINTMVRECATECLATGDLTSAEWAHLSTAKSLKVMFPAAGRQWVLLDLPTEGLSEAILALDRAELAAKR